MMLKNPLLFGKDFQVSSIKEATNFTNFTSLRFGCFVKFAEFAAVFRCVTFEHLPNAFAIA